MRFSSRAICIFLPTMLKCAPLEDLRCSTVLSLQGRQQDGLWVDYYERLLTAFVPFVRSSSRGLTG